MGEIADAILNGDFDMETGEYIGEGFGYPRTSSGKYPAQTKKRKKNKAKTKFVTGLCKLNGSTPMYATEATNGDTVTFNLEKKYRYEFDAKKGVCRIFLTDYGPQRKNLCVKKNEQDFNRLFKATGGENAK